MIRDCESSVFDELDCEAAAAFRLWEPCEAPSAPGPSPALRSLAWLRRSEAAAWACVVLEATPDSLRVFQVPASEQTPADTQPCLAMDLRLVRVQPLQAGSAEHPALLYGLRLMKNRQAASLYLEAEADFRRWKLFLATHCVQTDFDQRFRTLQQVGKGSFAQVGPAQQVFLVEDRSTLERFAAKRFHALALSAQKKGRQSLLNEVAVMRQLDHEHIVRFHQVQEAGGFVYLALEHLEGQTLYSFLKQHRGSLEVEDFKHIIRAVLAALSHLSSLNIIHRDLKPENLLFKSRDKPVCENTLKLIDFGLATRCDEPEYLFRRCGTPGYASPAVVNARSGDKTVFTPKCDIFSAGILLYELYARITRLVGRSPFRSKSLASLLEENRAGQVDLRHSDVEYVPDLGTRR